MNPMLVIRPPREAIERALESWQWLPIRGRERKRTAGPVGYARSDTPVGASNRCTRSGAMRTATIEPAGGRAPGAPRTVNTTPPDRR